MLASLKCWDTLSSGIMSSRSSTEVSKSGCKTRQLRIATADLQICMRHCCECRIPVTLNCFGLTAQELLEHPFLRPTEAPGGPQPGQVGLTRDQLKKLLTQVHHLPVVKMYTLRLMLTQEHLYESRFLALCNSKGGFIFLLALA